MEYTLENKKQLSLIGFSMETPVNIGFEKCPAFWAEIEQKYFSKINDGSEISKAIQENHIGEFGLCITRNNTLYYMIAGIYQGGNIPAGLEVIELENQQYLSFTSKGNVPEGLQQLIMEVDRDFLPAHREYQVDHEVMLEWYRMEENGPLKAGLWLPLKNKSV